MKRKVLIVAAALVVAAIATKLWIQKALRGAVHAKRRRKVIAAFAAVILVVIATALFMHPGLRRVGTIVSLLMDDGPSRLPVPVEGVAPRDLADTWGAPRSGNRRHEGIDIFAPRGRPVRSATRGIVWNVGENNLGGHVVEVMGPGGYWHYYAHLDSFADIEAGDVVEKGTVLGYVGDSGNAQGTPYHLHYGVYGFWGAAQNPYPLLGGASKEARANEPPRRQAPPKPKLRSRTRVS